MERERGIKITVVDSDKQCNLDCVTNRYLFWYDHDGKDGWTFEIEAKNYEEAYKKAYDTHGPQVADMMYQLM